MCSGGNGCSGGDLRKKQNSPDEINNVTPTPSPQCDSLLAGAVCLWDFQEPSGESRRSRGRENYALIEASGPVERATCAGAPLGSYAATLQRGQYFYIPRHDCPALNFCGSDTRFTVVAWIQRHRKPEIECEAIAGMWNETEGLRQYALFLDLRIHGAADNVCGHISATGGATSGHKWCMETSIGGSRVDYFTWHCVAISYDGQFVRSWLDGECQSNGEFNPYTHRSGVYDAGPHGADFTVGAVHRKGEMGNWFVGMLGGLAVFDRDLTPSEVGQLSSLGSQPDTARRG